MMGENRLPPRTPKPELVRVRRGKYYVLISKNEYDRLEQEKRDKKNIAAIDQWLQGKIDDAELKKKIKGEDK